MNARRGSSIVTVVVSAALTSTLLACDRSPVGPSATAFGLERIEPLDDWRGHYEDIEACVGRTGDFDRVEWFAADSIIPITEGIRPAGIWLVAQGRPHGIAIDRSVLERVSGPFGNREADDPIVRHEAIHEILQLASHEGRVWCDCDDDPWLFPHCS